MVEDDNCAKKHAKGCWKGNYLYMYINSFYFFRQCGDA
jgi:hypothetical protein